jgi:alcohol dehydrogenase
MKVKAAVLYEVGKKPPFTESLPMTVETVELDGPEDGEVLVEVYRACICHSDLAVVDGTRVRPVPMLLGHEASGIVREVGKGVTDLKPGDHVVFSYVAICGKCIYCSTGHPALCEPGTRANVQGTIMNGRNPFHNSRGTTLLQHSGVSAFSEYTVVVRESVVKIDPDIPLEIAAVFGCAIQTGVGSIINTASVKPGSSVAIFGAGGIGLSAIMGAKISGAFPIISIDILDNKLELARKVGATHIVNAKEVDPIQAIRDLTHGGVDYAFDATGSEQAFIQAYKATAKCGTTIGIGMYPPDRQFAVPALNLVVEERTVKGSYMGSCIPTRDLPRLLSLYKAGMLPVDLMISRTISLDDINSGMEALRKGEVARQLIDPKMGKRK